MHARIQTSWGSKPYSRFYESRFDLIGEIKMSEFVEDIRAIEQWGRDCGKADLKGQPRPDLILPSRRKLLAHTVAQTNPAYSNSSLESQV
jgi:hypothetical protein